MKTDTDEPSTLEVLQALGGAVPVLLLGPTHRHTLALQDWLRRRAPFARTIPISTPNVQRMLQGRRGPGLAIVQRAAHTPEAAQLLAGCGFSTIFGPDDPTG